MNTASEPIQDILLYDTIDEMGDLFGAAFGLCENILAISARTAYKSKIPTTLCSLQNKLHLRQELRQILFCL